MAGFKTYPHPDLLPEAVKFVFSDPNGNEVDLPFTLAEQLQFQLALRVQVQPPLPRNVTLNSLQTELMLRDWKSGRLIQPVMEFKFHEQGGEYVAESGTFILHADNCSERLEARVRVITVERDAHWSFDPYRVLVESRFTLLRSGPDNYFPFQLIFDTQSHVPWFFKFSGDLNTELDEGEPPLVLVMNEAHPLVKTCLDNPVNDKETLLQPLRRLAMVDCLTDFVMHFMQDLANGHYQELFADGTVGSLMTSFLYQKNDDDGTSQPKWNWVHTLAQQGRQIEFSLRQEIHHDLAVLLEQN